MKKILSLTGIAVMAAIVSTSAFAGNSIEHQVLQDNTSIRMDSVEQIGPTDASYSQYGYSGRGEHRGGQRGGHQGGRGGHGNGGHW